MDVTIIPTLQIRKLRCQEIKLLPRKEKVAELSLKPRLCFSIQLILFIYLFILLEYNCFITLPTKVHLVKAMVFLGIMYGCVGL